jgi:hypothetical protein
VVILPVHDRDLRGRMRERLTKSQATEARAQHHHTRRLIIYCVHHRKPRRSKIILRAAKALTQVKEIKPTIF